MVYSPGTTIQDSMTSVIRGFDSQYCYKIKGDNTNDYIIIYYYVVHQSMYSIVVIVVGY